MTRVAWMIGGVAWTGGINYFRNLAKALSLLDSPRIKLVLLGKPNNEENVFNSYESISYTLPKRYSALWFRIHLERQFCGRDTLLEKFLEQNHVDLLSHYIPLGEHSRIPSLCWIPDLQHRRLPHMFSIKERYLRDRAFLSMSNNAQGIIFSSENAREDFLRMCPRIKSKTYILPFVAYVPDSCADSSGVLKKYDIHEPYFHVPNQLWKHKNHRIILEALKIAAVNKEIPLVISTGDTGDYRHPQYFSELQAEVSNVNLTERFRFLGRIPLDDLSVIMRNSLALINPSYFEGWSTGVEEAKSTGKIVLLSDIPVHREQAPSRGIFFNPDEPQELYAAMRHVLNTCDAAREEEEANKARINLPERMRKYASLYEDIVIDALQ
ncbi:glycosyl transferase [Synergistales bacterium]|nr:glycosyl transferase [Synergistales bacterium]